MVKIDDKYLQDNLKDIKESIDSLKMIQGAFGCMNEEELEVYKDNLFNNDLNEYIAFCNAFEGVELNESMVRHVNSRGQRGMRKTRDVRSKLAYKTTSLSKAKRRETALKASKTRLSRPSMMKRASRKRNKARRKRASLGFDV